MLISVGGATYASFAGYTPDRIAASVKDFGLDGVDVDYEPSSATCALGGDGRVHCPSDQELIDVVRAFRQALPRPYWGTIASWSVGAYGEGKWQSAPPASGYAGISLALFRAAGDALDLVNVMSYDASTRV